MVRGMFFRACFNTQAIYYFDLSWSVAASETLVLLRFSFGFSSFCIACGLSWCWNGVPISCGPAHMVFARIFYRAYPPVLAIYYFDVS